MQNILITGGCGFIGTNFILYLLDQFEFKGKVVNVDKLTYAANPLNLARLEHLPKTRYEFIQADICDVAALDTVFNTQHIDTVCHFAAESHVDRSILGPGTFIESNIVGTFRLLELARKYQRQLIRFHHISTDEVFGSLGPTGYFNETTPYDPSSPYSASKASADHLVRAYGRTYGLPVTLSNCSNNYGPYQFPEKLIPLTILNALANIPIPVYGDGRNVRDWLYVEDHCRAVWRVMQKGRPGETYNVGGGGEITNIEVVTLICNLLDEMKPQPGQPPRTELITFVTDRPGHDRRYAIDSEKISQELAWTPKVSFRSGLRKTIQWYLSHPEWVNQVKSGEYRSWIARQYGEQ